MPRSAKVLLRRLRPRQGLLTFLIFLVISGICWLTTALNGETDHDVDVPVVYVHVPPNIILSADTVATVRVTIHAKRLALLRYTRRSSLLPLEIKFPEYRKQGRRMVVAPAEMRKLVTTYFDKATVSDIKPDRIAYSFVEGVPKSVPVRLSNAPTPATNYYLEHSEIAPPRVTVYAAPEVIDSIQYVSTEMLLGEGYDKATTYRVAIANNGTIKTIPDSVSVTLYPDVLTEGVLSVPITALHVPDDVAIKFFPATADVRFSVGATDFNKIEPAMFTVVFDYATLLPDVAHGSIILTQQPPEVKSATLVKNEVEYLLEK